MRGRGSSLCPVVGSGEGGRTCVEALAPLLSPVSSCTALCIGYVSEKYVPSGGGSGVRQLALLLCALCALLVLPSALTVSSFVLNVEVKAQWSVREEHTSSQLSPNVSLPLWRLVLDRVFRAALRRALNGWTRCLRSAVLGGSSLWRSLHIVPTFILSAIIGPCGRVWASFGL